MKDSPKRHGRTVCKSDYQTEHQRSRQKTKTPEYAAVRREHLKVERKLRRQKPNPARHEPLEVILRREGKLGNFTGRDT